MNNHMYEHAATQANLELLRERGVIVVDPGTGALALQARVGHRAPGRAGRAAGRRGGRGARPAARPWDGLRVLVTAGGTREPIDSVRFVGNRSSGRMGFALAEEAAACGADVTVVAANVALARTPRVRYVDVGTAAELQSACEAHFAHADVLLMAAAVADYRPAVAADTKLKKDAREELTIALERTPDILSASPPSAAPIRPLVGFAAEHGEGALATARDKRARKGLDAVVVNDISRTDIGFEGSENEVTIVTAAGERHVPRASKAEIARAILDAVGGPPQRGKDDGVSMRHRGGARPGRRGEIASAAAARARRRAGDHRRGRGAPRPAGHWRSLPRRPGRAPPRCSRRRPFPAAEVADRIEDRACDLGLGRARDMALAGGGDDRDLVV